MLLCAGFGGGPPGNPYMMGFQPTAVPRQMAAPPPNQYNMPNNRQQQGLICYVWELASSRVIHVYHDMWWSDKTNN